MSTTKVEGEQLSQKPQSQLVKNFGNCSMCIGSHFVFGCDKFLQLRHYKREEQVKIKGLCFRCLNTGHMSRSCPNTQEGCKVCGCWNPNHHTLLHKHATPETNDESITTVLHSSQVEQNIFQFYLFNQSK